MMRDYDEQRAPDYEATSRSVASRSSEVIVKRKGDEEHPSRPYRATTRRERFSGRPIYSHHYLQSEPTAAAVGAA
jgi:hypothetical protein